MQLAGCALILCKCFSSGQLQRTIVSRRENTKLTSQYYKGICARRCNDSSATSPIWAPIKCALIREVSSFQEANSTYSYEVGTWPIILFQHLRYADVHSYSYMHYEGSTTDAITVPTSLRLTLVSPHSRFHW